MSAESIAEAAAAGVTKALKKVDEEKPPVAEPESKLSEDDQERVSVLKKMEELNPDKYNGIAKRYEDSLAKFSEYADKWEKDHPGEEFVEDADEHKEFREANEKGLDWDDDHYTKAVVNIAKEEAKKEFEASMSPKLEAIQRAEKLREAAPVISAARVKNARDFFGKIGGEFKDLLAENGVVDPKLGGKLMAEDPIQWEIATNSADLTEKLVEENYKLYSAITPFDGKNPLHTAVNNIILGNEQRLMASPPEDRLDGNGRKFLPAADYWKLPETQRKTTWTFTQKEVEQLIVAATVKQAKSAIKGEQEKFDKQMKARGIVVPPKPAAPAAVVEEEVEKPNTPVPAASPRVNGGEGGALVENDPQSKFLNSFLN